MLPTTPPASLKPELFEAAGNVDLTCISTPPPDLLVEDLRRRGIDVVRIKWAGTAESKGWLSALFRSKKVGGSNTLIFADRRIRLENAARRGSAGGEVEIAMDQLSAVEFGSEMGNQQKRLRLNFDGGSLTIGEGLSEEALNWLRDRIILEAAGLAWKPLFNVGKRSTRITSNPDNELYRQWTSAHGRLISIYLDQAPPKAAELKAALAADERQRARAAAHWLKSTSAAVGATQLSELCQRLEIDLDSKDVIRIAALKPHLFAEFEKVCDALTNCRGEAAPLAKIGQGGGAPNPDGPLWGVSTLIVDDSRVNQEIASDCLLRAGASVTLASDGATAIEKASRVAFDVILMDCQMSGLDGFAATRAIREQERREGRPAAPIIALTANALRDDRALCLAAGMNDYLSKPFSEPDLLEKVSRWARPQALDHDGEAYSAAGPSGSDIAA